MVHILFYILGVVIKHASVWYYIFLLHQLMFILKLKKKKITDKIFLFQYLCTEVSATKLYTGVFALTLHMFKIHNLYTRPGKTHTGIFITRGGMHTRYTNNSASRRMLPLSHKHACGNACLSLLVSNYSLSFSGNNVVNTNSTFFNL
jgi:hypothetical protein